MIARQFLFLGLFMMIIGGLLALVVRWQLAWPETAIPGLGGILKETGGVLQPAQDKKAVTMHAPIMIFFVIRSEERRVGEEGRSRGVPDHLKKKKKKKNRMS